jgi:hypothetical protein
MFSQVDGTPRFTVYCLKTDKTESKVSSNHENIFIERLLQIVRLNLHMKSKHTHSAQNGVVRQPQKAKRACFNRN